MSGIARLVLDLKTRGIRPTVEGERLRLNGPRGALTAELRQRVSILKLDLVAYLKTVTLTGLPDPIPRLPGDQPIPLSYPQRRLWFLSRLDPASTAYTLVSALRLEGMLQVSGLEWAFAEIFRRHASTRTTIGMQDGLPVQRIMPVLACSLPLVDLSGLPQAKRDHAAREFAPDLARLPFDLGTGPLVRVFLSRLGHRLHHLSLAMHHLISDAWSIGILVRELNHFYRVWIEGGSAHLPEPSIQYADYAVWQRSRQGEPESRERLRFWREHLEGAPGLLNLPLDFPRPPVQGYRGDSEPFQLGRAESDSIRLICRGGGATPFMFFHAMLAILLSRYSGQTDVVIGTPVANRGRKELEGLIGFFANTLAIRLRPDEHLDLASFLAQRRRIALEAFSHQDVPLERVVEVLELERDPAYQPLFQVMFSFQNVRIEPPSLPALKATTLELEAPAVKLDLSLRLWQRRGRFQGKLQYRTDLFQKNTIRQMIDDFCRLAAAAPALANEPISRLPRPRLTTQHWGQAINASPRVPSGIDEMDPEERRLFFLRSTDSDRSPPGADILERFRKQAYTTPDRVALVRESLHLSYAALDREVERHARQLRQAGVTKEIRVGLCSPFPDRMIAGMLAVWRAGGAFLPLDADLPEGRLPFLLRDGDAALLLVPRAILTRFAGFEGPIIDASQRPGSTRDRPLPGPGVLPGPLAYLIHTSGSTGRPKGVMVTRAAISNYLNGIQQRLPLQPAGRSLALVSPLHADLGFTLLFYALCGGGRLYLLSRETVTHAPVFAATLERLHIDCFKITPSHLAALQPENGAATVLPRRLLILGGESASSCWIANLRRRYPRLGILNHYGPTEATVGMLTHGLGAGSAPPKTEILPLGRPLPRGRVYLLDRELEPIAAGAAGELCIAGTGLARGYVGRPHLTAAAFVPDPFSGAGGERLYQSGDRARYSRDGGVLFLGRLDHQVKLRGFRIEPGEIENTLKAHPRVAEAMVIAHAQGERDPVLTAYWTAEEPAPSHDDLRQFLASRLPAHMIPGQWPSLDAMPLTANGKIDRHALPAPPEIESGLEQPRTPTEIALAEIWATILQRKREAVGIHTSFFHLGGHSLLATRVIVRAQEALGVDLPLTELFLKPTIAALAASIDKNLQQRKTRALPPVETIQGITRHEFPWPLSFGQQRLWFLERLDPGRAGYHLPMVFGWEGAIRPNLMDRCLQTLIARHEVLRTRFRANRGTPYQSIVPPDSIRVKWIDAIALPETLAEPFCRKTLARDIRTPFSLEHGPLLRVSFYRPRPGFGLLLLNMHHIISDGWSHWLMFRELITFYRAFAHGRAPKLEPLPVQYADFAHWQRSHIGNTVLERQLAFWRTQLAEPSPHLDLALDKPRPAVQSYRGRLAGFHLRHKTSGRLQNLCREENVTPFMALFAVFARLLSLYSGQWDLCIGTPVSGRHHPRVESLIGFFVNTLVIRLQPRREAGFLELLRQVKRVLLEAFAHQDVPFEKVVEHLGPPRDMSRAPLFQALFSMRQPAWEEPLAPPALEGAVIQPERPEYPIAKFDLSLQTALDEGRFSGSFEYNTDLFKEDTVRRMIAHFRNLAAVLLDRPEEPLARLSPLAPRERRQLIQEWNRTERPYPRSRTIHQLFEARAATNGDAVALVFEERQLAYAMLEAAANRLAGRLLERGLQPEDAVGLLAASSIDSLIACLAILKAGGAYLPLDPGYPAARLHVMAEDAGLEYLLAPRALPQPGMLPPTMRPQSFLALEDMNPAGEQTSAPLSLPHVEPNQLAYIMFTSGSTGRPKGVAATHRNVVRLVCNTDYVSLSAEATLLQAAPLSFDAATFEIWGALLNGARLVLFPIQALDRLGKTLRRQGISILWLTAQLFHAMVRDRLGDLAGVRQLLAGGEALSATHVRDYLAGVEGTRLINGYGPTETVTFACCLDLRGHGPSETSVSIGTPIANTSAHVLDPRIEPSPIGVFGELFIGGDAPARGYFGDAACGAAAFLPDPFTPAACPGGRLYRSGDRARRRAGGHLELAGRLDRQLKLRGFRIEPAEIEQRLKQHAAIKNAVVLLTQGPHREPVLTAYIRAAAGESLSAAEIKGFLGASLPVYLIPSAFVFLERFPLSPNGKLDRAALPAPGETASAVTYQAPQTSSEKAVVAVGKELLGRERIGIHDNFFELGGHSLMATRVDSRLREYKGTELSIKALFEHPTPADLARYADILSWSRQGSAKDPARDVEQEIGIL